MFPFPGSLGAVQKKRDERARLLSADKVTLSSSHEDFLKASASEIVSRIQKGEWTASQVVDAYIAQATVAHVETNCVTEVLFKRATKDAKQLDEEFASTKRLRGPLHGVPFSVKDQYDIEGFDSCIGFSEWIDKPATKHAVLVDLLIKAGAIPIVKTNVPQTMFAFECNNPVWGRTTNPYNSAFTSGGSSGGEAACLAMDGSAFGIGSDIGGSLRIPTSFCGIYSLKPGAGRVPYSGTRSPMPGFDGIPSVAGPMARCVEDLELFCRTIFGQQDPTAHGLPPLPFREVTLPKQLKFGYYFSSGFVKESPAIKRSVLETVEALRKQGHECVEFSPPDGVEALSIYMALMSSDSFKTMRDNFGPDPMDDTVKLPFFGSMVPAFVRNIAASLITTLLGDSAFASVLRVTGKKSFHEYLKWVAKKDEWNEMFYTEVWHKYEFDGIIAPMLQMPQIKHGEGAVLNSVVADTMLYNFVDSPVGIVPAIRVDPAQDKLTDEWIKGPSTGSRLIEDKMYRQKGKMYDAESMKGMPVAVQVVGKRWEEEKVLAMMKVVDEALGERGFGPGACRRFKSDTK